jgi:hypothetical protein
MSAAIQNTSVKTMKSILETSVQVAAALAVLAFTSNASAQDAGAPKHKSEYCSTSKILGATVRMKPGAEAKRDAAKAGEPAKGPEGKIAELLVDGTNGALDTAIIEWGGFIGIGDKAVAVPFSSLTWNQAHERFEIDASEDRLVALPAFEVGKAKQDGIDAARDTAHAHWRTATRASDAGATIPEAKDANAKKPAAAKAIEGTSLFVVPVRYLCVSEIDDLPVHTDNEKVGGIDDLLVDTSKSTIALAILERGGTLGVGSTSYLVPFRSIRMCSNGDARVLHVPCATAEIEQAIVYEKPKNGVVDDEAAKRALANKTFDKRAKTEGADGDNR